MNTRRNKNQHLSRMELEHYILNDKVSPFVLIIRRKKTWTNEVLKSINLNLIMFIPLKDLYI